MEVADELVVQKPKVVIIGGPTAVGKSKLSLVLKSKHDGVLVNADATKLYKGLDGGANKWAVRGEGVRLWDLVDATLPGAEFSAGQYHDAACRELDHIIHVENKMPIVVGGSGLYIRWLMRGKQAGPQRDVSLSLSIQSEIQSLPWSEVISSIRHFDPLYAEKIVENDYRRAARAIELHRRTGSSVENLQRQRKGALLYDGSSSQSSSSSFSFSSNSDTPSPSLEHIEQQGDIIRTSTQQQQPQTTHSSFQDGIDFRPYILALPRVQLYDKICRRCENMILDGLFMEVWGLMRRGLSAQSTPGKAIGYRQTIDFLNSRQFTEESFMDFLHDFQSKTRQLAHRQLSWFRKEPDFLNIDLNDSTEQVITSHLSLSQKDWIELVKSQSTPLPAEIQADLTPLRQYQAPTGLLILPRVPRRLKDANYLRLVEERQALINRQLAILEQILFEMQRSGFQPNTHSSCEQVDDGHL